MCKQFSNICSGLALFILLFLKTLGDLQAREVLTFFFVKRFMDGTPLDSITKSDTRGIARLLAGIHAKGVVTDDAHADNFLRRPSGHGAYVTGRVAGYRSRFRRLCFL